MNEAEDGGTAKVRRANLQKGYETEKWETVYAGMRAQGKTIAQAKAEAWALVDSMRRAEAIQDRDAVLDKVFAESAGADMVAAAAQAPGLDPAAASLAWESKGQAEYCEGCGQQACNVILKIGEICGDRIEPDRALDEYVEANTDQAQPIEDPDTDDAGCPSAVDEKSPAQLVRCPSCGMAMLRREPCAYCGARFDEPASTEENLAAEMAAQNKAKRAAKRATLKGAKGRLSKNAIKEILMASKVFAEPPARKKARKARVSMKQPSEETIDKWMFDGYCKATDGCRVEPDGTCEHGCKSWALVLNLI